MEFDLSRVYTAVNAAELKPGSEVIVAYNLGVLKNNVLSNRFEGCVLQDVKSEFANARFVLGNGCSFPLAYLVEEPVTKKLKWQELKVGDVLRRVDGTMDALVTAVDRDSSLGSHILAGEWLSDTELEEWEKVEENEL